MSPRALLLLPLWLAACATAGDVRRPPMLADAGTAEAPRLPGEEVLERQPVIPPLSAFAAPVPSRTVLPGGLQVLVVERPGAPVQALSLVVLGGSASDPAGKPGLASVTAAMLEAGSARKSQAQIAALADALGAELKASARTDGLTLSISAQPTRLEAMAQLLADVALKPNFDPAEWRKVQAQRVAQLQEQLAEPRQAAANAFAAALYGDGPLGHTAGGTPASVQALTLDEVKRRWASAGPGSSALIAVGAASPAQVVALATRLFGGWKGPPTPSRPPPAQALATRPRLVLVEFPGRPQTMLQVGQPAVPMISPDSLPLRLMNSVLGGAFTSRLNASLREKHGYTYGAGSAFSFGRGPGPFTAATAVKSQVTGEALRELLSELTRVVEQPLDEAELSKGKALLAYGLVEQLQKSELTAALVSELFTSGAPLDTLQQFVPRLQALTVAEVQAATRRTLDPATMTITLVGDPGVLGQLEAAGLALPAPQRRSATGALSPASGK
jgi:zinc protease